MSAKQKNQQVSRAHVSNVTVIMTWHKPKTIKMIDWLTLTEDVHRMHESANREPTGAQTFYSLRPAPTRWGGRGQVPGAKSILLFQTGKFNTIITKVNWNGMEMDFSVCIGVFKHFYVLHLFCFIGSRLFNRSNLVGWTWRVEICALN